jgi:K+-transporting ATPase ATPase C chain
MLKQLRPAFLLLILLTILTGAIYPLVTTGLALALFPRQAHGSQMHEAGKIVGSELIGQWFDDPRYFWPRPSATSPTPYNAAASSGSNFGPLNEDLQKSIEARRDLLQKADPAAPATIPADLLTSSGSGLDRHISPQSALYQAGRVARSRGISLHQVQDAIADTTDGRQWGFLGEPRVNVLKLYLALDRIK